MKNIVFVLVTISVLLACGLPTGEPVAEVTAIPEKEIIESKWDEVTDSWTFPRGTQEEQYTNCGDNPRVVWRSVDVVGQDDNVYRCVPNTYGSFCLGGRNVGIIVGPEWDGNLSQKIEDKVRSFSSQIPGTSEQSSVTVGSCPEVAEDSAETIIVDGKTGP